MIWNDIEAIREKAPLIHNITNYVVMNSTANALLAIGASPVMAHASDEVEEMVAYAGALVINIGTLGAHWIESMVKAGREANRRKIPVVLDPVGCGATQFRTSTAQMLLREIHPAIVRGNASEIRSLLRSGPGGKGVDTRHSPDEVLADAQTLSREAGCAISVSGPVDIIVDGDRIARVANGSPMMTRVTGMGCAASALSGAFAAVNASRFDAAVHAMVVNGIAGEIAAERAAGPGSLQVHFLDVLYSLDQAELARRMAVQY